MDSSSIGSNNSMNSPTFSKGESPNRGRSCSDLSETSQAFIASCNKVREAGEMMRRVSANFHNALTDRVAESFSPPSDEFLASVKRLQDFCNTTELAIKVNALTEERIESFEGLIDELIQYADWSHLKNDPIRKDTVLKELWSIKESFRRTTRSSVQLNLITRVEAALKQACSSISPTTRISSLGEKRSVSQITVKGGVYFDETGHPII